VVVALFVTPPPRRAAVIHRQDDALPFLAVDIAHVTLCPPMYATLDPA
jgi:hypothetical protein